MDSNHFINPLEKLHADYSRDYILDLVNKHNRGELFTRFVANVKLCRFFTFTGIGRLRESEKNVFMEIAKSLEEPIKKDYNLLFEEEGFSDFRFYHLTIKRDENPGRMAPIKFDEEEHQKLLGWQSYNQQWHEALKEFLLIDKEGLPTEQFEPNIVKLTKADLLSFQEQQRGNNESPGHSSTATAPDVRKWKHDVQYLGFITAELIEHNRGIQILPLSKVMAKYFTDKSGKAIKFSTIKANIHKWRDHKDREKPFKMDETKRIMDIEMKTIREVIDYFQRTR